jgi:hypothetical protein
MSTTKWVMTQHSEIGFKVKCDVLFQVNFQSLMRRLKQRQQFRKRLKIVLDD